MIVPSSQVRREVEQLSSINRENFKSVDLQYLESFVPSGGSENFFTVSGLVLAGAAAVCRTFGINPTCPVARIAKSHPEFAGHFLSISTPKELKRLIPGVLPSTEVPSRPCTPMLKPEYPRLELKRFLETKPRLWSCHHAADGGFLSSVETAF